MLGDICLQIKHYRSAVADFHGGASAVSRDELFSDSGVFVLNFPTSVDVALVAHLLNDLPNKSHAIALPLEPLPFVPTRDADADESDDKEYEVHGNTNTGLLV